MKIQCLINVLFSITVFLSASITFALTKDEKIQNSQTLDILVDKQWSLKNKVSLTRMIDTFSPGSKVIFENPLSVDLNPYDVVLAIPSVIKKLYLNNSISLGSKGFLEKNVLAKLPDEYWSLVFCTRHGVKIKSIKDFLMQTHVNSSFSWIDPQHINEKLLNDNADLILDMQKEAFSSKNKYKKNRTPCALTSGSNSLIRNNPFVGGATLSYFFD